MAETQLMVTVMATRELKKWNPGSDPSGQPDEVSTETYPIQMPKADADRLRAEAEARQNGTD